MKSYIKNEFERVLTDKLFELKGEGNLPDNIKIDKVKIADIAFAFNNSELINLLRERGSHIMYQRYNQMREVEAKISDLKNQKFNQLIQPCDAFITFEEEDGGIIAQEFEPEFNFTGKKLPAKKQFMGDDLFLVEATEPTNIIWENRHFTSQDYIKRTLIACTIIFFLIMASFTVIFIAKMYAIITSNKYPTVDCDDINSIYNNDASLTEVYAYREW